MNELCDCAFLRFNSTCTIWSCLYNYSPTDFEMLELIEVYVNFGRNNLKVSFIGLPRYCSKCSEALWYHA